MNKPTFPHRYQVEIEGKGPSGSLQAPPRVPIVGGAPAQFGGTDEWWSPEDLLLGSVGLCLMTTFHSFANKGELAIQQERYRVDGTLDKTKAGLVFTSIRLEVELTVPAADVSRAEKLLDTAEKYCIISNALNVPVTLEASVRAG